MPLLTTKETAAHCNMSPSFFHKSRIRGGGPRFIRVGRAVRYDARRVTEWLAANEFRSTSDPPPPTEAAAPPPARPRRRKAKAGNQCLPQQHHCEKNEAGFARQREAGCPVNHRAGCEDRRKLQSLPVGRERGGRP